MKNRLEKGPWFDAEAKTRRAERAYRQQIKNLGLDVSKVSKQMSEVLSEFRGKPSDAAEFACEMALVQKRLDWLNAVAHKCDEEELINKINDQNQSGAAAPDDITESRDLSAVARAGPCPGFELLKTLGHLDAMGENFRPCTSQDDIKRTFDDIQPRKKAVSVLMQACRAAVANLLGARKRALENKKRQEEKDLKAAADERKRSEAGAGPVSKRAGDFV